MEEEDSLELIQFEKLIEGLITDNYGCCDDFLSQDIIRGLNANLDRFSLLGDLKYSAVGNAQNRVEDKTIRGDQINWIDNLSMDVFESSYIKKIEKFVRYLNSTCFTAITTFESHYAKYEVLSFYKRHLDQFKNEKARQFSIVLYLNEDWKEDDGGNLTLYPAGKDQISIAPMGGRLVFFRSNEMEHEVQVSQTRDRRSIAAWLKV